MRFPGFSDEWNNHCLTYFFDFKNGLNPEAKRFGQGVKFISVSDILNNDFIDYDKIIASVTPTEKEICEFGVNRGDILFQRSSETLEDVGQANVYLDDRTALFGGFVIRGKKIGEYDPYFMRYALSAPVNRKKIIVKGAGAQHFNIGQEGLSKVEINTPTIPEQVRIGNLLHRIDERIATQNKLIDNLQSLIKGLAKALTQQGEPKTRISECLDCHTSTLQESHLQESGIYPVYGACGIAGYLDDFSCDNDSILIIKDGSGVGTVSHASGKYSVIGTLNYLTAKSGYSLEYLYFCLMSFNFEPFKTGMAIPHIYFKDYGQSKIWCPSLEKQKIIAEILSAIEEKMKIESEILSSLHLKRSYLLNNMFI